jgi:hypothetical protein
MKLLTLFASTVCLLLGGCFGPSDIPDTEGAHLAGSIPHTEEGFVFGTNEWFIRTGPNPGGAGSNYWGSGKESVEVVDNKLHLRIAQLNGRWTSAEIMTPIPDGKRGAVIMITSPTHDLDPRLVIGMFAYRDDHNELDIEISRFGSPASLNNAQYAVHSPRGGVEKYPFSIKAAPDAAAPIHTITWGPRVSPGVGLGVEPISFATDGAGVRESWDYAGSPVNLQRAWLHINVWLYEGKPPANGQPIDVEIGSIRFY